MELVRLLAKALVSRHYSMANYLGTTKSEHITDNVNSMIDLIEANESELMLEHEDAVSQVIPLLDTWLDIQPDLANLALTYEELRAQILIYVKEHQECPVLTNSSKVFKYILTTDMSHEAMLEFTKEHNQFKSVLSWVTHRIPHVVERVKTAAESVNAKIEPLRLLGLLERTKKA